MADKREIMFIYDRFNGRTTIDCQDTFNWLLDMDSTIAYKFKEKWESALKAMPIKKGELLK